MCLPWALQRIGDRAPPARRIAGKPAPTSVSGQSLLCPGAHTLGTGEKQQRNLRYRMGQTRRTAMAALEKLARNRCGSWLAGDAPRGRRSICDTPQASSPAPLRNTRSTRHHHPPEVSSCYIFPRHLRLSCSGPEPSVAANILFQWRCFALLSFLVHKGSFPGCSPPTPSSSC